MLPLSCYNDKQFYQETLPEAICCCLQTRLLLIFILLIECFMYKEIKNPMDFKKEAYRDCIIRKDDKIGIT